MNFLNLFLAAFIWFIKRQELDPTSPGMAKNRKTIEKVCFYSYLKNVEILQKSVFLIPL